MSWSRKLSSDEEHRIFTLGDVYRIGFDELRQKKKPLRLAILGAGGVAQTKHLPAIIELIGRWEPISICGLSTHDLTQNKKLSSIWKLPVYSDSATLLREEAPDVVIVAAPDQAHHDLAIESLEAGADVMVEKPLAHDTISACSIIDRADTLGRLVVTMANKRYSPPYVAAKDWLKSGRIGEPRLLNAKFFLGYDYVNLLNQGTIHMLDLLLWFGGEVTDVRAVKAVGTEKQHLVSTLRFRSGAIGALATSDGALSLHPWERLEVLGDGPWIEVNDQSDSILHPAEGQASEKWNPVIPNTLVSGAEWGGYVGAIEDWLDAVRGAPLRSTTSRDGFRAIALAEAIKLSADKFGEPIQVLS